MMRRLPHLCIRGILSLQDGEGNSALLLAIQCEYPNIVRMLLAFGGPHTALPRYKRMCMLRCAVLRYAILCCAMLC
jgi:hypothetical protein